MVSPHSSVGFNVFEARGNMDINNVCVPLITHLLDMRNIPEGNTQGLWKSDCNLLVDQRPRRNSRRVDK